MSDLTPKERETLKLRKAELKSLMDLLRPALNDTNVEEWTALYLEREEIDGKLGDDF